MTVRPLSVGYAVLASVTSGAECEPTSCSSPRIPTSPLSAPAFVIRTCVVPGNMSKYNNVLKSP